MLSIYQTQNLNDGADSIDFGGRTVWFTVRRKVLRVNARLADSAEYTQSLCDELFRRYPVRCVVLENCRIHNGGGYNHSFCLPSDVVNLRLDLPPTLEQYTSLLGKKTRQHLKWYQRKLDDATKECGGNAFSAYRADAATEELFGEVVRLNHERMDSKSMVSHQDAAVLRHALGEHALVCAVTVGEAVIGGTISSVYGGELNLHVIAHDNAWGQYNPGQLALIGTIGWAISHGIGTFNFLWGDSEYKTRFLGKKEQLWYYVIARTKCAAFLYHLRFGVRFCVRDTMRSAKSAAKRVLGRLGILQSARSLRKKAERLAQGKRNTSAGKV